MKRTLFGVTALALALTASASVAQAQVASPVKFGVSGGISIPTGDAGDVLKSGYNVSGLIGFQAPMVPVGLRADVSYNSFKIKGLSSENVHYFSGTLNGMFNLGMAPMVSPYVIAGVGVYNAKSSISGSKSETDFGLNGGAGLKFNMSGFSTFAEARYHYILSKDDKTGAKNTSIIPISFGIMF